jgi:hypothetical protein
MAKSNYTFISGEAIDVGSPGEHDFVIESGSQVTDTGVSDIVFEAGTGLGGVSAVLIDDFEDGNTIEYKGTGLSIGSNDPIDGQFSGRFVSQTNAVAYRDDVTFAPPETVSVAFEARKDINSFYFYIGYDDNDAEGVGFEVTIGTSATIECQSFLDFKRGPTATVAGGVNEGAVYLMEFDWTETTLRTRIYDAAGQMLGDTGEVTYAYTKTGGLAISAFSQTDPNLLIDNIARGPPSPIE